MLQQVIIKYSSLISHLIPLALFFLFFKKNWGKIELKVIFFYIFYSLLNDILLLSMEGHRHIVPKIIVFSVFTLMEYVLMSLFFYLIIKGKILRTLIKICSILFIALTIVNFIYLGKSAKFDSLPVTIECILIIIFSIFYLFEQVSKPQEVFIYLSPSFWVVVGCFIYLSGTFFLFIQVAFMPENEGVNYWFINLFCNIVKNIFFAIAFGIKNDPSNNVSIRKPYNI